ncbi:MAG: PAS domain S-box protein, partial [Anaerolineae bacterium]
MTEAGQDRLLRETWYRAIAGSGYVPLRADQVRERLGELLTVATRILQEERFDRQAAEGIGRALVAMHYLQPQAVGRTVGLFARELLAPLPVEQAVALQPRLADLLDALVAGYFRQAYDTVLLEQDEVRSALLAELRATERALRRARDDLEVRVHERTAELARANRELRAEIERRQQVEHALRESEARHRRLVECSDDLIFSLDRAGTFCTAGGFRLREFGLEPHEVIGRRLDDLFPPEKAREYHERHRHVFDSGQALTYEHDFEFDGVTRTDLTTIYPIPNEQGEIEQVGVICRDVTVHKRAEQALRESEERYRDLVDASPTGIFALQDGRYVFANPAGRRLLGYDPGELIGVLAVDTIHPDSLQLVLDRMETAQDGGPNPPVEMKVVRRDGSTLLTESTSVPVTLNGEPAILIIGQDITA